MTCSFEPGEPDPRDLAIMALLQGRRGVVSPAVDGDASDFFFTHEVSAIRASDGEVLWHLEH